MHPSLNRDQHSGFPTFVLRELENRVPTHLFTIGMAEAEKDQVSHSLLVLGQIILNPCL